MTTDQAALVFVVPGDDAERVLQRVLAAGGERVNLLVSDAATALRDPAQAARLQQAAQAHSIDLILISADPQTLAAARSSRITTLSVSGAPVLAPGQSLPPPPPAQPISELRAGDADFLRSLDDLDLAPPVHRDADADTVFAADLDSIDVEATTRPTAPSQRVRPEDIELSAAERARAAGHAAPSRPARVQPARSDPAATQPMPRRSAVVPVPVEQPRAAGTSWLIPALSALLVLLLLAISFVLVFGNRATVTISAPARPDAVVPIADLPLPIASPGSGDTSTAIAAEALASDVAFSAEGTVTESTLAPSGTASGVVQVLSLNTQPFSLPAGTEFIAVQPNGQEVPFISGSDVVVPPATTQDTGAAVVTNRGVIDVSVSARSAGSASNVDANSIRRIVLPNGQSFGVESGNLTVRHNQILGGSEAEVRIVRESDVQPVLAAALTGLDAEARRQISGLAAARGLALEETTITPRRSDLEQLQGFEAFVRPAVGETLSPESATFNVTVQARYAALATPSGEPLQDQIADVFTEQLRQAGLISPGDCRAPFVTDWRWNGSVLTVDGDIRPDPACGADLDAAVYNQVREAVRGKSRAEAAAALDGLVAQGVIGSYTLPDRETMPGWGWQIRVE
jgi:hypothetical protein